MDKYIDSLKKQIKFGCEQNDTLRTKFTALREAMKELKDHLLGLDEIDLKNYEESEICEMNAGMMDAYYMALTALEAADE